MPKVSFDGVNKIITVTQAPVNSRVDIDVKIDIYSDWKEWVLVGDNSKYAQALRAVGGDPVSEAKNLGTTYFLLNGWKIRPYEANHRLILTGNLYTDPSGESPVIGTIGSYGVIVEYSVSNLVDSSITSLPTIEHSSFEGCVSIEPSSPYSGTEFPVGTPLYPVNNIVDAMLIADERGFHDIHVHENLVITSGIFTGMKFIADRPLVSLAFTENAEVYNSMFIEFTLSGILQNTNVIDRCFVHDLHLKSGIIHGSILNGTLTVDNSNPASSLVIKDCADLHGENTIPTFDLQNFQGLVSIQGYNGDLYFKNVVYNRPHMITMVGDLVLDSSCTTGTFSVRGIGTVTNNGTSTVSITQLVASEKNAQAVWDMLKTSITQPGSIGELVKKIDKKVDDTQALVLAT